MFTGANTGCQPPAADPAFDHDLLGHLAWGSLTATEAYPLLLTAQLCDLRPRFLPKCRVGQGYRAVARNGRILLASDVEVSDLEGRFARVRLQTWHRAILPGDVPEPYGLLLCVRRSTTIGSASHATELIRRADRADTSGDLFLDVGGGTVLAFHQLKTATSK